ncbi:hypothetical protein N7486_000628 [Penicillium sp. IBT 16267x]|nr:hypothetical protein N7486_000628 [Penicillium sp. IBT 16267x]
MTTTEPLTYWPESGDRNVNVVDPEVLSWDSQYDQDSVVENLPDSFFCIDSSQEVFPDFSDFLFGQYSLLTSGDAASQMVTNMG